MNASLRVDWVDSIEEFEALRAEWDAAYHVDPHATIHRSWAWLRGWIEFVSHDWAVLVVRLKRSSRCVAFLPLGIAVNDRSGQPVIHMGGTPLSAHTGFVCVPEYSDAAIPLLSKCVQNQMPRHELEITDVLDPRIERFLEGLPKWRYRVARVAGTPCPYIELPDTWEMFLTEFLTTKARRNVRRLLREVDRLDDFSARHADDRNLGELIEITLRLWTQRWKGSGKQLQDFQTLIRNAHAYGFLRLVVYEDGATPVSAAVRFVDEHKKAISGFMLCFNQEYRRIHSPGQAALIMDIRHAIENGFKTYDNGRGDLPYKYALGAKQRFNSNYQVRRKSIRSSLVNRADRMRAQLAQMI